MKKISSICSIIILALVLVPVMIAHFYTFPCADDFSYANMYVQNGNSILASIRTEYTLWQGTYLPAIFVPVYYLYGLNVFRWVMFFDTLFFCITASVLFWIFIGVFLNVSLKERCYITLLISTLFFLFVFNTNTLQENIYFFIGAVVYTLPLSLAFIAMACFIYPKRTNNKIPAVIIGILAGILASGGNVPIAVYMCSVMALGIILDILNEKRINLFRVAIFVPTVAGALANVAAPGWRCRYNTHQGNDFSLLDSLSGGLQHMLRYLGSIIVDYWMLFIVFVAITAILSYRYIDTGGKNYRLPGLLWLYSFIAAGVAALPSLIGFDWDTLPPRGDFVIHVALFTYIVFSTIYTLGWIKQSRLKDKVDILIEKWSTKKVIIFAVIVLALCGVFVADYGVKELTVPKMVWHMAKGDYKAHDERWRSAIEQLEADGDKERLVHLYPPKEDEWVNVQGIGITENRYFWSNQDIAQYYGLDMIELWWIH